jgi:hypothetical protein
MAKLLLTVSDVLKAESWTTKHNVKIIYTCANTDGWCNKLVTIFARYLDNFIVTINFSILYLTRDFGSRQVLPLEDFIIRRAVSFNELTSSTL